MTESEWLACDDPTLMLPSVAGRVSDRKLRLFACACVRRVWHLLADRRSQQAVRAAEQHADAPLSPAELEVAASDADAPVRDLSLYATVEHQAMGAASSLFHHEVQQTAEDASQYAVGAAQYVARASGLLTAAMRAESGQQAAILRDVLGWPIPSDRFVPAKLTPTVLALAQATYEVRLLPSGELDPARLAVLSDALEESGCTDAALLAHLRSPGPHVRGCWALDLVLGKS